MASVYRNFDESFHIDYEIILKYLQVTHMKYLIILAGVKIQKIIRGYLARKQYKKHKHAIITMQRFIRGLLQRFHLIRMWQIQYNIVCLRNFHDKAIQIQTAWRGYQLRKTFDVKKILEEKEKVRNQNEKIKNMMIKMFTEEADEFSIGNQREYVDQFMDVLFERHHLLRTIQKEGVLSIHNSKELSVVEKLLNAISYSSYIKESRKIYKECVKHCDDDMKYRFTYKHLQRLEKIARTSKLVQDKKKWECLKPTPTFNNKEYYAKCPTPKYERSIFGTEKYVPPFNEIVRTTDKSKQISEKDFDLFTLKKVIKENDIPPYFLQFWLGKECTLHNFVDF